jgi:flagellar biosynthetic protein FliP
VTAAAASGPPAPGRPGAPTAAGARRRRVLLILAAGVLIALATPAQGQSLSLGEDLLGGDFTGRLIQLFLLITVLSLAPGILMMATCFPFMIIVLSILRQGLGVQQTPPNMMMVSLALFLTFFVMEPVFTAAWRKACGRTSTATSPRSRRSSGRSRRFGRTWRGGWRPTPRA